MQTEISFPVHSNSVKVYREKIKPELSGRKLQVIQAIRDLGNQATMYEVSEHLNVPLNCISGRTSELKRMNLIEETGTKEHHGNQFAIYRIKVTNTDTE